MCNFGDGEYFYPGPPRGDGLISWSNGPRALQVLKDNWMTILTG